MERGRPWPRRPAARRGREAMARAEGAAPHGGPVLPMGQGGYELVAPLSAGGMAELFLARRRGPWALAHPVVVKRLRPEVRCDPSIAEMFVREAWISARLAHPNVAMFHDFVWHDGRYHLVLEYVPGCDLAAAARYLARAGRPFPLLEAVEIAVGVLRALAHAHGLRGDSGRPLGVVHRDVSPQNVLLSVHGEVKLVDFGVAKVAAGALPAARWPVAARLRGQGAPIADPASTGAGLLKGKLGYAAPEQLLGEPVDARADLFAVGVVLFELVSGRRLFERRDDGATVRAALSGAVPALAPLRPACPLLLEEVVRRALAPRAEHRFQAAADMEEALREVLAGLGEARARRGGSAAEEGITALAREVAAARDGGVVQAPPQRSAGPGERAAEAPAGRRGVGSRAAPSWKALRARPDAPGAALDPLGAASRGADGAGDVVTLRLRAAVAPAKGAWSAWAWIVIAALATLAGALAQWVGRSAGWLLGR